MKVSKILSAFLALIMIIGCFGAISVSADGGSESTPYTVYVSASGDDSAEGTSSTTPVLTLNKAIELINNSKEESAVISIVGEFATPSNTNFTETAHTATITYTGFNEEASLKMNKQFGINGPVVFKDLTINPVADTRYFYHNGHSLVMDTGLTFTKQTMRIQAGYGGTTDFDKGVNLTIKSGEYSHVVLSNLNGGTIKGDVNVLIDGEDVDITALHIGSSDNDATKTTAFENKVNVNIKSGYVRSLRIGTERADHTSCTFNDLVYIKINGGHLYSDGVFGGNEYSGKTTFSDKGCVIDFSGYKDSSTENMQTVKAWKDRLNVTENIPDAYKEKFKVTDASVVGMQAKTESAGDKTDIRFLVGLRDYKNTAATIRIVAKWGENNERTFTQPITTVYGSISEVTDKGLKEVKATDKGVRYIMALTLTGVPTNVGNITFEVTPIITVNGGTAVEGPTSILEYPTDVE